MDRKVIEKMLAQGNDSAMLRYTLGSLLLKEDLSGEAVLHLEQALAQDSNHSASWKLYARALAAEGRRSEAIEAFEKGIAVAEKRGDKAVVAAPCISLRRASCLAELALQRLEKHGPDELDTLSPQYLQYPAKAAEEE